MIAGRMVESMPAPGAYGWLAEHEPGTQGIFVRIAASALEDAPHHEDSLPMVQRHASNYYE